ncbi:ankyrin-1-like isoform X1 [Dreissena polymorpha]|uniref:ankyrin-1-like isoform X1 n=1 Tax=Dreissena polymorpha TaxID=45954 RepID=UPI002264B8F9|nr:ankyrin-1-like isoform X1 [Dreissena polymorpha]
MEAFETGHHRTETETTMATDAVDSETRSVQAMLVDWVMSLALSEEMLGKSEEMPEKSEEMLEKSEEMPVNSEEMLENWKSYIDTTIIYESCSSHYQPLTSLSHKDGDAEISDVVSCIRDGKCHCEEENKLQIKFRLIHLTCIHKDLLSVLKMLVCRGCDLEISSSFEGKNPLQLAVKYCNEGAVKTLLENGANTNVSDDQNDGSVTPIWYAVVHDFEAIVQLLLKQPLLNLNLKNKRGYPLLHWCLRSYESRYLDVLLSAGADPNVTDSNMNSAVMIAVSSHKVDVIKLLIRYGADVNKKNRRNETPLLVAVYGGQTDIMELFLDAGADPNCISRETPLFMASFEGDLQSVRMLIKYHANVRLTNDLKYSPLHVAAWNGHCEIVEELLKAGAPHDEQTSDLNTPLGLAAHGRHLSVVKKLLPLGCRVNVEDKDRDTPLLYAAYNGMTLTCKLLVELGANPNCSNRINATPLWNAVYMGHKETVKYLLKTNVQMEVSSVGINQHHHSDDVLLIYDQPRSPLWVAVERGHTDIVLLLLTAGYNVYQESWLFDGEFPGEQIDNSLRDMLCDYVHNVPKLISLCRNFLRKRCGQNIEEDVDKLYIPNTLKSYLKLSYLGYSTDENSENSELTRE